MQDEILGVYDIYGVHHVPFWHESWFIHTTAIIFCVIVCIVSFLIAIFFHKKAQSIVIIDDWTWCFRLIVALRPDEPISSDHIDSFYDDLIHVLKKYICMRYGLAYHSATSSELCTKMQEKGDHYLNDVVPVLERGICIKFGHMPIDCGQCQKDYDTVYNFIVSTGPSAASDNR